MAKDGSGQKASIKYTVYQNAREAYINANSYENTIARGKSLTLSTSVIPSNASVKKFTGWTITKQGGGISNISIKNGKVTTKKDTPTGLYNVSAKIVNLDGSTVNATTTVRVIDSRITKIVPEKKSLQVFRARNDFGCSMQNEMKLSIVGGERTGNAPNANAFSVSVSNPALLKVGGISAGSDGSITVGLLLPKIKADRKGIGTGKVKVTVSAIDGGGAKASFVVNVVNPVSSVKIGPAKSGVNMAVATGKTLALKATLGTGYGAISNKNVKWSVLPAYQNDIMINQKGIVTPLRRDDEVSNGKKIVKVKAEALDGSKAFEEAEIWLYANVGKMQICGQAGELGKNIKASGKVSMSSPTTIFYVLVNKRNYASGLDFDDLIVSSSNPSVGTVKVVAKNYHYKSEEGKFYYIYTCEARGYKKGSTKLTIKTKDGSQSVSYKLSVTK